MNNKVAVVRSHRIVQSQPANTPEVDKVESVEEPTAEITPKKDAPVKRRTVVARLPPVPLRAGVRGDDPELRGQPRPEDSALVLSRFRASRRPTTANGRSPRTKAFR